jgi:3-deoxy-manno-octulosonate cytidylyltransferase (CMP-KDO synthetase)
LNTAITIPARLASTRFPNKMLAELNGVPLIKHVYNRCIETGFDTFVVTPDKEIVDVIGKDNTLLVGDAENGTARCVLATEYINYTNFINVQGDMPDITADIIHSVHNVLEEYNVATAYTTMTEEQRSDPNSVKILHNNKTAKWFGRGITGYGDHHLGIYGYKNVELTSYKDLVQYPEEDIEKLEQLRWIQNDIEIGVVEVEFKGIEINTLSDLSKWEENYNN